MKTIALIFSLILIMQTTAFTCDYVYPETTTSYEMSDAVFSGTVVETSFGQGAAHAVIQVYAVWKGELSSTETVRTMHGSCGGPWVEGQTYLIFAYASEGGLSSVNTGSQQIGGVLNDLFYLDEPMMLLNQDAGAASIFRVGNEHVWLPMLGLVASGDDAVSNRWVKHAQHGWIYISQIDDSTAWVWDPSIGWIWASKDFGNWFWIITETTSGWFYFMPSDYPTQSLWFYDLTTAEYVSVPVD